MQVLHVDRKKKQTEIPAIVHEEVVVKPSDAQPLELGLELFSSESEINALRDDITQSINPAVTSLSVLANKAVLEKDWEKAKSSLERALKIAPGDASIWRRLAYCYYQTGNYQQALAQAQRASSLSLKTNREQILNRELIDLITLEM
jgi:tetratricopeptide (TPR) repeat protein